MPSRNLPAFPNLATLLALGPAIEHGSCVVCRVHERMSSRAMFWFLTENYNEAPTIQLLLRSHGFCAVHLNELIERDGRHQIAATSEHITEHLIHAIDRVVASLPRSRGVPRPGLIFGRRGAVGTLAPEADCPFCEEVRESEVSTLADLTACGDDAEIRASLTLLCVPHGMAAARHASIGVAQVIVDSLAKRLGAASLGGTTTDLLHFLLGVPLRPRRGDSPSIAQTLFASPRGVVPAVPVTHASIPTLTPEGCPICDAQVDADRSLPNVPVHQLCSTHAWRALEEDPRRADALGSWAMRALAYVAPIGGRGRRSLPREVGACPACASMRSAAAATATAIAGADVLQVSRAAICMLHLPMTLRGAPIATARLMLDAERTRLVGLHGELVEYFRKQAYENRHEPLGAEQTAWLRAARLIAGSLVRDDADVLPAVRIEASLTP